MYLHPAISVSSLPAPACFLWMMVATSSNSFFRSSNFLLVPGSRYSWWGREVEAETIFTTSLPSMSTCSSLAISSCFGNAVAKMSDFSFNEDISVQGSLTRTARTTSCRLVVCLVDRQDKSKWCSMVPSARLSTIKEAV